MKNAAEYFALAREREAIRRKRDAGAPPPWSADAIFNGWRFCNVHRENDKTTRWFRENVRSRLQGLRAVEATAIFRWFNRIETGQRVRDLLINGWDTAEARRRLEAMGVPVFTGAYKISNKNSAIFTGAYIIKSPDGQSKLEGILGCIDIARERLPAFTARWGESLEGAWRDLCLLPLLGSFMAYEIVSDLRWTPVLASASDILTWAAAGPGCARGLGWAVDGDPERYRYGSRSSQAEMRQVMHDLLAMSRDPAYWPYTDAPWEMREAEHWACETWKYIRCRDHGQPPRQRFRPTMELA